MGFGIDALIPSRERGAGIRLGTPNERSPKLMINKILENVPCIFKNQQLITSLTTVSMTTLHLLER
jgi:hypothetical protein